MNVKVKKTFIKAPMVSLRSPHKFNNCLTRIKPYTSDKVIGL